jgi:group II intron reverse transcriptase/maturase
MTNALMLDSMSPELLRVAERAKREPEGQFHALAHLIDVAALARAYRRLRKKAGVGVDGMTKEQYGQDLDQNLQDLHQRLKAKRYRHQPIRRVSIPKGQGQCRPIGISVTEDKVVQGALRDVLEAIYETEFTESSYGFRPNRGAHDALRTLNRAGQGSEMNWILEADIVSYFDSVDRNKLKEMIQKRVADGALMRLIGKCLNVGVLDGEAYSEPAVGTAQGSVLSPLLGNIYLHYVLDLWVESEVTPHLRGKCIFVRYCDDFIVGFERQDDAEWVTMLLGKRMGTYGLTLHPNKTRLFSFGRPSVGQSFGKGSGSFDFLGFTLYWKRSRRGRWILAFKTRRARLTRAIRSAYDRCRRHRHLPVKEQHTALVRHVRGHMNYFGVNGNIRSLHLLLVQVQRTWFKWLRRRSQRTRLTWERYQDLLRDFPLPRPRIVVQIWGR